ncbi:hypothetical protein [Mycolicibacterium lutetiense]|jgi:hypothetical protein|uniref:Nitrous oxide reductase accessory protein NosL n=1 Tax=Mycolicibacterium lutetiense TaxID=1641992 RepID=A0ABS4ZP82_9MYCO|nr:hypothetical protein [Mycolicibacterium lutetiense]MBP2450938.1 nitrous oxide reductase accessory protein NosL [Mycolicibacterium lutetiense]
MGKRLIAVILAVMVIVAGCGKSDNAAAAIVTPGHDQASPSDAYTAVAEEGPDENGVKTWVVVIRDKAGQEVFHDHSSYRTPGVMITWLPTEPEQLWVYSGDAGVYRIAPGSHGGWTRSVVKRENVPPEISSLGESSRS